MFVASMEKTWFRPAMEYSLMIYTLNGKGMVLLKIVFRSGDRTGKR